MKKILITSYTNPDVDGVSCAYAYAEFLQKQGQDVVAGIFGDPHPEAQFVLDKFNINKIQNGELLIIDHPNIVFVDASDLDALPKFIDSKQVVEIIDHRKVHETEKFVNANSQIELVGSCATLIAEKFYQKNTPISRESAVLLYSAIASNTINFKNNVTTKRDIKIAAWLKLQIELPADYIHEMFAHKSNFIKPIKETVLSDFKLLTINNEKLGIGQLEIINAIEYTKNNLKEIENVLTEIKQEKSLDYILLSFIDLDLAKNTFVVIDEKTKKLLELSLKIKFHGSTAQSDHIIMRKELHPIIKEILEIK